ncbi:Maf family nucleotide pyrophosphatase [Candidatus Mesenet endosymbiont of Phosphuga atrata]|uniref:Maf family nucleotide pyrophosphatase n=1 Tax=Candidatus Mesenet endosymbiont of Phosphuga atrata TaxID=3066221 RepID=UPI0030D0C43A
MKISNLILASSSKQRLDLLNQINVSPGLIVSPDIDESLNKKALPKQYSIRMAQSKVHAVRKSYSDYFILSADTVVSCGRRVLPKTETKQEAEKCIRLLSGRRHRVYTTICLLTPNDSVHVKSTMTIIKFKRLTEQEISNYLLSSQWNGKAGGCNLQGITGMFILWLRGSYFSAIGLPLYETYCLLSQYGLLEDSIVDIQKL